MDNRRQDYRHTFSPAERLHVELGFAGQTVPLDGEAIDLSVGGMGVQLNQVPAKVEVQRRCRIHLELPGDHRLTMPAVVVHSREGESPFLGVRFLPLAEPAATAARDKAIWVFLLEQQRHQRRRMRDSA